MAKQKLWISASGDKFRGTPEQVLRMIAADHGISAPVSAPKRLPGGKIECLGVTLSPVEEG